MRLKGNHRQLTSVRNPRIICHHTVDPFEFELAHNKAHSRGGKLTAANTSVLNLIFELATGKPIYFEFFGAITN